MKKLYRNSQVEEAISKLNRVLPDKDVCNGQLFQKFCNTEISQDFTRKSLKRINVKKVKFMDCCFKAAAGTGSKFSDAHFNNCDFSGSNFQYCYFNKVTFAHNSLIKGANFSHSIFMDCKFENITLIESTLYDCYFENCIFDSDTIRSDTMENSVLYSCIIRNIDLAHINLEYIRIENGHMENVILPPYQIAYIIGAPIYIKNTNEDVYIYTDKGKISSHAYCELFGDLAAYYYSHKEYFPMSNLLIALDKHELAFEYIQLGVKEACDYFDFRMIKHFCRLACTNDAYTHTQLKKLYDLITDLSYNNEWDLNTLHSYMLNIGEIRELLLNCSSSDKQRVEFVIKTNIEKDDLTSINKLYNQINKIIRENCSDTHIDFVELRHNSPYELYITCIDMLPNIFTFIISMYGILSAANKFLDIYRNFEETRRVHQENELYQYEKEARKLDIELKKLEREERIKNLNKKDSSQIYTVTEIEHNIKCSTVDLAKKIAPEYLHYKYSQNIPEQ